MPVKPVCCPLCGVLAEVAIRRVLDPNTMETFAVHQCPKCKLGITAPQPGNLDPYYKRRYYGGRHWITRRYCAWRRVRVITLSTRTPGVLVDIGCGDGSFLLEARRVGWRVLGTEINARIPAPGLEIWGSIDELIPLAPFDCITLWHSLEHLRDPVGGLRRLRSLLKPEGRLILSVPNARGMQARLFGRHWLHLDVPRHLHHFGPEPLRRTLQEAGFTLLDVWHHEAEYDVFGWMQSALNKIFHEPNILFDFVTRHGRRVSRPVIALNLVLGVVLFPLAFALTVVTTLLGSGGTIIAAAAPHQS